MGHPFELGPDPIQVDRRRRGHVLQVRLGLTAISRPAQTKGPHPLRDRSFDSCTMSVELLPLLAGMAHARLLQGLILRMRLELEVTDLLFGPCAERSGADFANILT